MAKHLARQDVRQYPRAYPQAGPPQPAGTSGASNAEQHSENARTLFRSAKPPLLPERHRSSAESLPMHAMIPEGDFRFIALDVETACGDAASICQIGLACVAMDNSIHGFSTLVKPGTRFDPFNTRLHGIGPADVADAPRFAQAFDSLFPLLSRHRLVQHSSFDKRAFAAACQSCGLDTPDFHWSDSVQIARRAWPELKGNGGHGLGNLKKVLQLDFHHHDAGEDARAAAMVVLLAESRLGLTFEALITPPLRATPFVPFPR